MRGPLSEFWTNWSFLVQPYLILLACEKSENLHIILQKYNRARRQSGFPTFISCQRQDANVLPKRRQSHQGDKLCDVSTVPLVARWPVFLARGSDADGEPHWTAGHQIQTWPLSEGKFTDFPFVVIHCLRLPPTPCRVEPCSSYGRADPPLLLQYTVHQGV